MKYTDPRLINVIEYLMDLSFKERTLIASQILSSKSPRRAWEKHIENVHMPLSTSNLSIELIRKQNEGNIGIIPCYEESYPKSFKQLHDPPFIIFSKGDLSLLSRKKRIGIVGSRNASDAMLDFCQSLSKDISDKGYTIVSGYAQGVDSAAHKGALDGNGSTIAILGTGFNYPLFRRYATLNSRMEEMGLFLTEYLPGKRVVKDDFIQRNRLISALADSFIVVTPALKSGSYSLLCNALKLKKRVIVLLEDKDSTPEYLDKGRFSCLPRVYIGVKTKEVLSLLKSPYPDSTDLSILALW